MEIVLSHTSALAFWLAQPTREDYLPARTIAAESPGPATTADFDYASIVLPGEATNAIHILGDRHCENADRRFKIHTCTLPLPRTAIVRVGDDLLACSPELALIQSATILSDIDFIRAGYALCGTYRLHDDDNAYSARPLTSPARIQSLLEKLGPIHGAKKARLLTKRITPGAALARETMLAMHLTLPYRMGGFGLPAPLLNPKVSLTPFQQQLAGKSYLSPDLYWPNHAVSVEYDSDEFHTGSRKIAIDAHRRDVMAHLGITEITVTKQQFNDLVTFNKVAHIVSGAIGHRINPRRSDFPSLQFELRARLLAPIDFNA